MPDDAMFQYSKGGRFAHLAEANRGPRQRPAAASTEPVEFEYEGFFTHWVCPCGHNDWTEGDTRGEEIECPMCDTKGVIASD